MLSILRPFSGRSTLVCAVALLFCAIQGLAQRSLQVLHNHVPAAVSNREARQMGALPQTQHMHVSLVLPLRNQDELSDLLGRLYNPASPDFHHFLSVDQFTERFGPTAEDYEAVVAFAQENGFTVTKRHKNRLLVPISGTAAQIEKAFDVSMKVYQHPTEKRTFFSADREPSLNLSVPVSHIEGLNNFFIPRPATTGSGSGGSYLPGDMRAAYYGGTALTGSGQIISLVEFGGYDICSVVASFAGAATSSSCVVPSPGYVGTSSDGLSYNLSYTTGGVGYNILINNVLVEDDVDLGADGYDDSEQALDIAQSIGMAPGLSQVRVYIGDGSQEADILNAIATEDSENFSNQISISWLWFPFTIDDAIFAEFAAQGQTVFAAAGDWGGYPTANGYPPYPAESPYVTAVGGTELTTNGAGGSWNSEIAWSATPQNLGYAGGGGQSPDGYLIPTWQVGVANLSNGGSITLRNVPDVAAEAGTGNFGCNFVGCWDGLGGTSSATPRWAGFMALVNEQAHNAGLSPLGFINPALYSIGQSASYNFDFHDITSGNNECCGGTTWYSAVTGYDLVTGWGSPNGQNLINALTGVPIDTPAFSPVGGTYTSAAPSVTITDGTPGVTIYYTTNGSTPTASSAVYSTPISASNGETIKAIAVSWASSAIASATYTLQVAPVVFSVPGGTYNTSQNVFVSDTTPGAQLYCTVDGSTPTTSSFNCTLDPMSMTVSGTLRVLAVKSGWTSVYGSAMYNFVVHTPTFSPAGGTYSSPQSVTLSVASSGTCCATLYYTTDGSTPTASSPVYSTPITVSGSETVKAIAVETGWTSSAIATAGYTVRVTQPTFSPDGGTYTTAQTVSISSTTPGTTIYYTTNGVTPTTSSPVYTGPITIAASVTLQATAVAAGWVNSPNKQAVYTFSGPTFSPMAGSYSTTQTVTISSPLTVSNTIYYTTDGTIPTTGSNVYTSPITISSSKTINAFSYHSVGIHTPVGSATFTIASPGLLIFTPAAGTYSGSQTVSLSIPAYPAVVIHYTTDGTAATTSSPIYTAPITVSANKTINTEFFSLDQYHYPAATYTITPLPTAAPAFSPGTGIYSSNQTVTISSTTPGAVIYYTTDGTTPQTLSPQYINPITVSATETVKAIAIAPDTPTSPVGSAVYTFLP